MSTVLADYCMVWVCVYLCKVIIGHTKIHQQSDLIIFFEETSQVLHSLVGQLCGASNANIQPETQLWSKIRTIIVT